MKRLIAAVSLAVLATPVLADAGKPFEQIDLDRALPNVAERTVSHVEDHPRLAGDRALPALGIERSQRASAGTARSDRGIVAVPGVAPCSTAHRHAPPGPAA